MGRGSTEKKLDIFYYELRTQRDKQNDPHFKGSKGGGDKRESLPDEHKLSGLLTKIGHGSYEYPKGSGKMVDTIHLFLMDGDETYKIGTSIDTGLARALMNRLISIRDWEFLEIRIYLDKKKQPSLFVANNGEAVSWAYGYRPKEGQIQQDGEVFLEQLVIKYQDPKGKEGEMLNNWMKVNTLLLNAWKECEPLVAQNARSNKTIAAAIAAATGTAPTDRVEPSTTAHNPTAAKEAESLKMSDLDVGDEPAGQDEDWLTKAAAQTEQKNGVHDDLPF